MAVAFPLIVLMVVGILELGVAFKDFLTVSAASREGARVAALAGSNDQADCAVVIGIASLVTPTDLARVDRVEIYHAAEGTGAQGATNIARRNVANDPSVCSQPHGPNDGWTISPVAYPATSRQTEVGPLNLDLIGVRVILNRTWITGFPPFRGPMTIDETTITRVEPEVFAPPP